MDSQPEEAIVNEYMCIPGTRLCEKDPFGDALMVRASNILVAGLLALGEDRFSEQDHCLVRVASHAEARRTDTVADRYVVMRSGLWFLVHNNGLRLPPALEEQRQALIFRGEPRLNLPRPAAVELEALEKINEVLRATPVVYVE